MKLHTHLCPGHGTRYTCQRAKCFGGDVLQCETCDKEDREYDREFSRRQQAHRANKPNRGVDLDENRNSQLIRILQLMQRGFATFDEAAAEFDVSPRTIFRDCLAIQGAGIDIEIRGNWRKGSFKIARKQRIFA